MLRSRLDQPKKAATPKATMLKPTANLAVVAADETIATTEMATATRTWTKTVDLADAADDDVAAVVVSVMNNNRQPRRKDNNLVVEADAVAADVAINNRIEAVVVGSNKVVADSKVVAGNARRTRAK